MSQFAKNILGTLIAAALVANVTVLWGINSRLATLEAQMHFLTQNKQLAQK
jgi:hypothetical protein